MQKINYWVFQYTTKVYKNVLKDFELNRIFIWEVTKHRKNIKNGDIAIIYIGGNDAKSVYGLMNITSDVFFDNEKGKYYVEVYIKENWSKNPITYNEAKTIIPKIFIGISGTNFRSNYNQLSILKNYILKKSLDMDK